MNIQSASVFGSQGKTKKKKHKAKINKHENKTTVGKVMQPKAYPLKISIELTSFKEHWENEGRT